MLCERELFEEMVNSILDGSYNSYRGRKRETISLTAGPSAALPKNNN